MALNMKCFREEYRLRLSKIANDKTISNITDTPEITISLLPYAECSILLLELTRRLTVAKKLTTNYTVFYSACSTRTKLTCMCTKQSLNSRKTWDEENRPAVDNNSGCVRLSRNKRLSAICSAS